MNIGVVRERNNGEKRVAITPEIARKFAEKGINVFVEKNAGDDAGFDDQAYIDAKAKIITEPQQVAQKADILLCIELPEEKVTSQMKNGNVILGLINPYKNKKRLEKIAAQKANCFAAELIPRISRAQNMDVLSSQANLAGYKAVIKSADSYGRIFPMLMTAAGMIAPARVLIIGAGVAGLQAIATAKRLGAIVSATDVRLEAKENIISLGAKFVGVDTKEQNNQTESGYAKQTGKEFQKKQNEILQEEIKKQNIVITTAMVPGKKAPLIVTKKMIENMLPGSIIFDLSIGWGGNCQLSKADQKIVHNQVTIIAPSNPLAELASEASTLLSRNFFNFAQLIIDKESKKIHIDMEDEIINGAIITSEGKFYDDKIK